MIHVGRLTANEKRSVQRVLATRWPEPWEARLIREVRRYKQQITRLIAGLAPKCGVHFHGHEMRRKK
jgi:hypothetical protein